MKITILGAPASGKGTQGEMLADSLKLPRLSVGALIRRHSMEKTIQGIKIEKFMLQGLAIPADTYMEIVGEWINSHPDGFIIDNLIRSVEQLEAFDSFSKKNGLNLDFVFNLRVNEEEAYKRLTVRKFLKARPDETPEAVRARFTTYNRCLIAIRKYFSEREIYFEIDANKNAVEVRQNILTIIERNRIRI